MSAKLRIKTKGIEIEWEGEVEFLKAEVPDLIASIIEAIGGGVAEEDDTDSTSSESSLQSTRSNGSFTTAAAAAKLQVKTGADLFKAALARLQISEGIEPVSRSAILDEMKLAPRFFKPAMRGNLSKIIDSLLAQGEVNEPSSGNYVLAQSIHEQIVRKLNS